VRRARFLVDQRHLAEEVALAEHRQDHFPAVFTDQDDLDLALRDHVERIPGVVLKQNHRVARVAALPSDLRHPVELGRG